MHDGGFKRWVVWGVLASASWLVVGCGYLPRSGGSYAVAPGFVRDPAQAGYNGTIKQLATSIDPRTPQTDGTPGRSLPMDAGERVLLERRGQPTQGIGGSGPAPSADRALSTSNEVSTARSRPGQPAHYEGPHPNPLLKTR